MQLIKRTLMEALAEAGEVLLKGFGRKKTISFKGDIDLVTETDKKAERLIIKRIHSRFPSHSILGEESGLTDKSSPHKWIIDPLDGTTNFAHNFPQSCTSIGYEFEGKVLMGGIYDPFRKELFFAQKGKGAFLNKKRIRVSEVNTLKRSLLVTGFPYDRTERPAYYLKFVSQFLQKTQGIRRLGSSALDLCYVACGRFDGYWELKLNPWDVSAGTLIVREAGGRVTNTQGEEHSIYEPQMLATNSLIHTQMLDLLQAADKSE